MNRQWIVAATLLLVGCNPQLTKVPTISENGIAEIDQLFQGEWIEMKSLVWSQSLQARIESYTMGRLVKWMRRMMLKCQEMPFLILPR